MLYSYLPKFSDSYTTCIFFIVISFTKIPQTDDTTVGRIFTS